MFQIVHDPDLAQVCPRYHMGYTYMFKVCIYLEVRFIRCSVFYLFNLESSNLVFLDQLDSSNSSGLIL